MLCSFTFKKDISPLLLSKMGSLFSKYDLGNKILKGQITNYKPAIQITSISIKSDSIPLSGEFGHIVRVVGVPFLALNCDRCTADKSTVYIKCRLHKCLHLTIIMICI